MEDSSQRPSRHGGGGKAPEEGRHGGGGEAAEEGRSPSWSWKAFMVAVGEWKEYFIEKINDGFCWWAASVYRYPWVVIAGTLLVMGCLGTGLLPGILVRVEGAERNYALPDSLAKQHQAIHTSLFGERNYNREFVIVTGKGKNRGKNILTWKNLEKLQELNLLIRGINVEPKTRRRISIPVDEPDGFGGEATKQYTFDDQLCFKRPDGTCSVNSILEMGALDLKLLLGDQTDTPEIYEFEEGVTFNQQRQFFPIEYYLGGVKKETCRRSVPPELFKDVPGIVIPEDRDDQGRVTLNFTCVKEAQALMFSYDLEIGTDTALERTNQWEQAFIEVMSDYTNLEKPGKDFPGLEVSFMAFRSRDDELARATRSASDIIFVVITFFVLIIYATWQNFSCDLFKSKAMPAFAGCCSALLAVLGGMGLCSHMGVEFVPTALVSIFLIMGIGADDVFVIINSYALAYMVERAHERMAVAMRDCGISITITTVTNLLALFIGSFSPYLSIRNFCLYSFFGLLCGYVCALTIFLAVLCLDAKREEALQVCPFFLPKKTPVDERVEARESAPGYQPPLDPDLSTFSLVSFKAKALAKRKQLRYTHKEEHPARPSNPPVSTVPGGRKRPPTANNPMPGSTTNGRSSSSRSQQQMANAGTPKSTATMMTVTPKSTKSSGSAGSRNPPLSEIPEEGPHKGAREDSMDHIPPGMDAELFEEPKGNVGRKWRLFFLYYYGQFITHPVAKVTILLFFLTLVCIAIYGVTKLERGLELSLLSPDDSYLKPFDQDLEEFFTTYELAPTEVFFESREDWSRPETQRSLDRLHNRLYSEERTILVLNPLKRILDDPDIGPSLKNQNNKTEFNRNLKRVLEAKDSLYKIFEHEFVWEGEELVSFRMFVMTEFLPNSEIRAKWMQTIRDYCAKQAEDSEEPLTAIPFNVLMIFFEGDLQIVPSLIQNLTIAGFVMFMVATVLIPNVASALLVLLIMGMIDIVVIGFMSFWGLQLNMLTMINLVMSIGFSVDYSAHIIHTFTHCEGETRNLRVVESLVLMGNPIFHGAVSTQIGIFGMAFSASYLFRVFFKMMTLVVGFGVAHGIILLPVILSLVGTMEKPHGEGHEEDQVTVNNENSDEKDRGGKKGPKTPATNKSRYSNGSSNSTPAEGNTGTTRIPNTPSLTPGSDGGGGPHKWSTPPPPPSSTNAFALTPHARQMPLHLSGKHDKHRGGGAKTESSSGHPDDLEAAHEYSILKDRQHAPRGSSRTHHMHRDSYSGTRSLTDHVEAENQRALSQASSSYSRQRGNPHKVQRHKSGRHRSRERDDKNGIPALRDLLPEDQGQARHEGDGHALQRYTHRRERREKRRDRDRSSSRQSRERRSSGERHDDSSRHDRSRRSSRRGERDRERGGGRDDGGDDELPTDFIEGIGKAFRASLPEVGLRTLSI